MGFAFFSQGRVRCFQPFDLLLEAVALLSITNVLLVLFVELVKFELHLLSSSNFMAQVMLQSSSLCPQLVFFFSSSGVLRGKISYDGRDLFLKALNFAAESLFRLAAFLELPLEMMQSAVECFILVAFFLDVVSPSIA